MLTVPVSARSEEHTSELQSHLNLVCRLLLEKKNEEREDHSVSRTICVACCVVVCTVAVNTECESSTKFVHSSRLLSFTFFFFFLINRPPPKFTPFPPPAPFRI